MSVKHGLLALLARHSLHGYELRRELEDELGAEWSVNYGQIYATLERLVRDGLVVQSETIASPEAPDRKLYTVTPAGRARLRDWFLTPTGPGDAGRDELFAKVLLALTGDVDMEQVFQVERKANLRRIGQLTDMKERLDPDLRLSSVLHVDLAIMKTEAVLRWLEVAESKIRRAAAREADSVVLDGPPEPIARVMPNDSPSLAERKERT